MAVYRSTVGRAGRPGRSGTIYVLHDSENRKESEMVISIRCGGVDSVDMLLRVLELHELTL